MTTTIEPRLYSDMPQIEAAHLVDDVGLSYKQVAAIQGVPIGTVMSRVSRGRNFAQKAEQKAQREAEREAEREARKAERTRQEIERKAQRKIAREAQKAQREAQRKIAREAQKAQREAERIRYRQSDLIPHVRIANEMRRRIDAGEWQPGERLPSVRKVARQYDVAIATASKALRVLEDAGLVDIVDNWGTFLKLAQSEHGEQRESVTGPLSAQ